ncbi:MAG: hypothetical protein HRU21_13320, partial [Pseudomonadales bacterium]|nr:hypothetical protein [Pseudomonadales bacterium]
LNRAYRILNNAQLAQAISVRNAPLYEAIEDDIVERQLGVSFVWDLDGTENTQKRVDLSNDQFEDYQNYRDYEVLPNAEIWGDNQRFSEGSSLFSGIKRINQAKSVVEASLSNGRYSFDLQKINDGSVSLEDIPLIYSLVNNQRLAYVYTLNYINQFTLFISFDQTRAYFYRSPIDTEAVASVSYAVDVAAATITVNTDELSLENRDALQLSPHFKPIITGPFLSDDIDLSNGNSDAYYYTGKAYYTAEKSAVSPIFLFNPSAKQDIETQFLRWREEIYDDFF